MKIPNRYMMKKEIPMFWGCTLTHNYPFLIKSTRIMLEHLGVDAVDVENFGCCPDPIYVKAYGKDMQLALSARNLALAERKNRELLVVCNGCFNILHGANKELKDHKLRDKVNSLLPENAGYGGEIKVTHILNTLTSQLPIIKTLIKKPLNGLRVAVHYGCHALYPTAVPSDNPENPASMDEIVKAAGAESIDYEEKLACCGIPVITFDKEEADRMLRSKLMNMKDKVDCVVTACPACFMRFDIPPAELKELSVPVLHISELLCLALGVPPKELFLEGHTTKVDPVLEKLKLEKPTETELVKKYFDINELESHCEACRKECTAAVITKDTQNPFDPLDTVDKLLDGKFYEIIRGKEIWRCLQCGKCEERCPNNMGLKDLFSKLRELAIEDGQTPKIIEDKIEMLKETGYAMPKRIGIRKRMGIEPAPEIESKEIKQILGKIRRKAK